MELYYACHVCIGNYIYSGTKFMGVLVSPVLYDKSPASEVLHVSWVQCTTDPQLLLFHLVKS